MYVTFVREFLWKFISLTFFAQLIEAPVPELLGVAAELWVPLSRGDLEVEAPDPGGHPADPAVAGQEPAPETQAAQAGGQVGEGGLGEAGHGVTVQGQQGQAGDTGERVLGQHAEKVEAEIENLQMLRTLNTRRLLNQ